MDFINHMRCSFVCIYLFLGCKSNTGFDSQYTACYSLLQKIRKYATKIERYYIIGFYLLVMLPNNGQKVLDMLQRI